MDDLDAVLELLASGSRRRSSGASRRGSPSPPPARSAFVRPPHVPRRSCACAAAGTAPERDARAVRHHYDVSNEFFALFLGEAMTYSCAIFSRGATTLEEAQETKLELVCTKLA